MQRGSLISTRTLSLHDGQRESLLDWALMGVLQRGQVSWMGSVVS